jgi:hypothetical protein
MQYILLITNYHINGKKKFNNFWRKDFYGMIKEEFDEVIQQKII